MCVSEWLYGASIWGPIGGESEEVRQHHKPIPYEYVNKESLCTFYHSLFSDHFILVRFQVLLFV